MYRKLSGFLLSLVCAFGMVTTVSAASEPTVKTESTASAITKIYDYQPLASGKSGPVSSDALVCTVTERIYDAKGNFYLLEDSSPLHDSSLFSRRTKATVGVDVIRSITPVADPDGNTRSAFRIALTKEYSGQQAVLAFTSTYTAKEDTVLTVKSVRGNQSVSLLIKKDAEIASNCKLVLNADTIAVTNYTEAHLKTRLKQ